MKDHGNFSQHANSFSNAGHDLDSVTDNNLNEFATPDEDLLDFLSTSELESLHAGEKAFGYGASYHTSTYQPSVLGFVTYLATGYINGINFR